MIEVERLCKGCMRKLDEGVDICPVCGFSQKTKLERSEKCLPEYTILNGRYLLGRVLGEGGFGITYLAEDLAEEQAVAIKEYFPMGLVSRNVKEAGNEEISVLSGEQGDYYRSGLKKFSEEAHNLEKFREWPGIVTARDFFAANGTAYLVMDYIEGQSLKQYMKWYMQQSPGHMPMDYDTAIAFLKPVMESLAQMHQVGLIHRDISPDNILVDKNGTVTLIDFGAARIDMRDGEHSMTVMVKHGYAPEEQYRKHGRQGTWTDVYALCATLYHMISGKLPEESVERLYQDEVVPLKKLPLVNSVPESISDVIEKGMAVRAENRCQTVGELWQKLKDALDKLEAQNQKEEIEKAKCLSQEEVPQEQTEQKEIVLEEKEAPLEQPMHKNKKGKHWIIAACIGIAALGGLGTVLWTREQKQSQYAKLTDYVSLDSYVEGDSRYILSKEEVEKLRIRKSDYYRDYPQEVLENAVDEADVTAAIQKDLEGFSEQWNAQEDYEANVKEYPEKYALLYSAETKLVSFMNRDGITEFQADQQGMETIMREKWRSYLYARYYPLYIRSFHANGGYRIANTFAGKTFKMYSYSSEDKESLTVDRTSDDQHLRLVGYGDKGGYMTVDGKVAIPLMFDYVGVFSDGLAPAGYQFAQGGEENDNIGYINALGEIVIPTIFDRAEPFSEGYAAVSFQTYAPSEKEYWGYVDTNGNLRCVFRTDFTESDTEGGYGMEGVLPLAPCQDGIFLVGVREMDSMNDKGGYYLFDQNGNLVTSFDEKYELGAYLPCGLALVHDFTGIMEIWKECESNEEFSQRLSEEHANGTQADFVDAWYINTAGEQVGEKMHMSVYDLAEFEIQVLSNNAVTRYSIWLPEIQEKYFGVQSE